VSALRALETAQVLSKAVGEAALVESILGALRDLRYGSIEIVVHDARVVQIVRTEKLRIDR
jgi:hypothetical protein